MSADSRSVGIVITTISDGSFLARFHQALSARTKHTMLYILGDLSTPATCEEHCRIYRQQGLNCLYLSVEDQLKFMKRFPQLDARIPWRSDSRRNVGFLRALADGCDVLVSMDDDNFPILAEKFLGDHLMVGAFRTEPLLDCHGHWFNPCSLIDCLDHTGSRASVYARGFPYRARFSDMSRCGYEQSRGFVCVNAGLWLGDPDVDAATRTGLKCESVSSSATRSGFLRERTRACINSQNTALFWQAIPAYYFISMGQKISSLSFGRYGDILSGFFLQVCCAAVGGRVRIGLPTVKHVRNAHNVLFDLWQELPGMVLVDEIAELIEQQPSPATGFDDAYMKFADRLEDWGRDRTIPFWGATLEEWSGECAQTMRLWVDACRTLSTRPLSYKTKAPPS